LQMRDRDLYAKLLGIEAPWFVRDVDARLDEGKVEVVLGFDKDVRLACPDCGAEGHASDAIYCRYCGSSLG